MPADTNPKIEEVIYYYTTNMNEIEQENKTLKEAVQTLKTELDKFKRTPLMVGEVHDMVEGKAIIKIPNGNQFLVEVATTVQGLVAGDVVLCEQKNLTILAKVNTAKNFNVEQFVIVEKPSVTWEHIGGLEKQAREIQEVIELPLLKPQLFEKMGITPPKGILLYGPPGTGKTLLAKAAAAATQSTFIEVVGSELVQKFIGEGAKQIKEIFQLARTKSPTIIFIDEIDALASKRIDVGTSGEREVQRTFMQLLSEIDGFKPLGNVKIIGCTNRKDILDPAILRPGRLDRLIHVPVPNKEGRKEIFMIHSKQMPIDRTKLNIEKLMERMDGFSGAEIKAVCTEAGYFAIREEAKKVSEQYFLNAIDKVKASEEAEGKDYMKMFG